MHNIDILPREGNVYKANLHSHSTLSDGSWTLEKMKQEYKNQGYSILAYTDHNYYAWHKELSDDNFIAIAGLEVNIDEIQAPGSFIGTNKTYHLNFFDTKPLEHSNLALPPVPEYNNKKAINEYIQAMNDLGFICCYNHPRWSLQNGDDYCDLKGLFAMEIYNYNCDTGSMLGDTSQAYDDMLRSGQKIFCLATDDNHDDFPDDFHRFDSFGGWVNIKAKSLSYDAIIDALKSGNFYSSSGPEIHELFIENNVLYVKCSPVVSINVFNTTRKCFRAVAKKGETITEAQFNFADYPHFENFKGYFRVTCQDKYAKKAFSNACFIES